MNSKNDIVYKILFAIELALLPLVISAHILIKNEWGVSIFIGLIALVRVWLEFFKIKDNKIHEILSVIASIASAFTILIFFMIQGILARPLVILALIVLTMFNLMRVALVARKMPSIIEAIDFCFVLFEIVVLIALLFVNMNAQLSSIALYALILSGLASIIYKIYFSFKYTDFVSNIKKFFQKR